MSLLDNILQSHLDAAEKLNNDAETKMQIELSAEKICSAIKNDKKLLLFGNGGSAADAQHIAAEFVGKFNCDRDSYNAVALTTNTSVLTAIGNDIDFKYVFSRQLSSFAQKGDIAVGITTSGKSENVVLGLLEAKRLGIFTIMLTGVGDFCEVADLTIRVPSSVTARIQEMHILIGHYWADYTEKSLCVSER